MKKVVSLYTESPLILRIAIGLLIGICLGLWLPQVSFVSVLGTIFVGALKGIAPVLVFVLVIASLASAGKGIGGRFRTVIIFYMVSTFLAAVVAVLASYLFPVAIPLTDAVQQSAQLLYVRWRVVQTLHHDILKRHSSLTCEVILSQDVGYLADRIGILDWHNLLALLVKWIVKTHGKVYLRLIKEATQIFGYASR